LYLFAVWEVALGIGVWLAVTGKLLEGHESCTIEICKAYSTPKYLKKCFENDKSQIEGKKL
jgi:hypothetical protein